MTTTRTFIFYIGYTLTTIIYGSLSLVLWLVPKLLRHKIIVSWTGLTLFWLRLCCGVKADIQGLQNIDINKGPYVVLSKHQSAWETLYLQGLFSPASTILKKELLKIPFFGWGLRGLQPIGIDRSNPREALKQVKVQSAARLASGLNIVLFPEGTRVAPGESGKYARSGADIARDNNRPILPVAHNAGYCWPSDSKLKHAGTISVRIGEPIYPEGKDSKTLMAEVKQWIETEMESLIQ